MIGEQEKKNSVWKNVWQEEERKKHPLNSRGMSSRCSEIERSRRGIIQTGIMSVKERKN